MRKNLAYLIDEDEDLHPIAAPRKPRPPKEAVKPPKRAPSNHQQFESVKELKAKIVAYLEQNELNKAMTYLDFLRENQQEQPKLLAKSLCDLTRYTSDPEWHLTLLAEACDLNPLDPIALTSYGKALADNGLYEQAYARYEESLALERNNTMTLTSYGKALADNGLFKEAYARYEESLALERNNTTTLTSYGKALADNGLYEAAYARYEESLALEPHDTTTLTSYGKALADNGLYEAAYARYEESLALERNNTTTLNSYGKALADNELYETAYARYEESLALHRNNTMTLNSYGKALADNGLYEAAYARYEESLVLERNNTTTLTSYGKALADNGLYEAAYARYEESLALERNNTMTLTSYGKALADNGLYEVAYARYEESLALERNNTTTLNSYGKALADNGLYEAAYARYEESLALEPDDTIAMFSYATALEMGHEYRRAIVWLERLSQRPQPNYFLNVIYFSLGRLYYLLKDEVKGSDYFTRAVQNYGNIDLARLRQAQHILAVRPYSHEAVEILQTIGGNSPYAAQALRLMTLNLDSQAHFEHFNSEPSWVDVKLVNRGIYHKIQNEVSLLRILVLPLLSQEAMQRHLGQVMDGLEAISAEITARRQAEQQQTEQLPTHDYQATLALISRTAHDIADFVNNELATMKLRVQQLLRQLSPTEPTYARVQKIISQITFAETALNDLKAVNEGIKLRVTRFKVADLFTFWQENSHLKNATITVTIENHALEFEGDEAKIKSFLSELIENSLKHNAPQANLTISLQAREVKGLPSQVLGVLKVPKIASQHTYLALIMADNGRGIPLDKKEWVFRPLNTTSPEGSGLGLFLIRRTLQEMHGYIIETGAAGARFEIYIPIGDIDEPTQLT